MHTFASLTDVVIVVMSKVDLKLPVFPDLTPSAQQSFDLWYDTISDEERQWVISEHAHSWSMGPLRTQPDRT